MTQDSDPRASRRSAVSAWDDGGGAVSETGVPGSHGSADRPLPPLPDGGLAAAMPDWLRGNPEVGGPAGDDGEGGGVPPSGEVIDPTTFLTEDDLPDWLRRLAAGSGGGAAVRGPASFGEGAGRSVPAAAFRTQPTSPRRGSTDPVRDGDGRRMRVDQMGEIDGSGGRSSSAPAVAVPRAAEPLRPAAPRPVPELGRAGPAAGGARVLAVALVVLLVLILVLLAVTVW